MNTTKIKKEKLKNNNRKDKNRERKVILGILVPITLIIIAISIFLGCWFGCKPKGGGPGPIPTPTPPQPIIPPPPPKALVINKDTINENNEQYKIKAGTTIYDSANTLTLGHDDLDVKAYSDAHNHMVDFVIEGTINFGFLVGPEMKFHLLSAPTGSLVELKAPTNDACGVLIGQTTSNSGEYKGIMNIENNVNFKISSATASAYGVRFYKTESNSEQWINGVWSISALSSNTYGVFNSNEASGTLTVGGVWKITGSATIGIGFTTTTATSHERINGVWAITSSGIFATGVYFIYGASGTIDVDGVWNIDGPSAAVYGVNFDSILSSTLTVNGTWTIYADYAYCVRFYPTNSGSQQTVNGIWTVYGSSEAKSVHFEFPTTNDTLIIQGTQYFSNKNDSGNIFTTISASNGTYLWNGININKSRPPAKTDDDAKLATKPIYDKGNSVLDCDLWVSVINDATSVGHKTTFNNTLKKALNDYASNNECPKIAKQWLLDIIKQL